MAILRRAVVVLNPAAGGGRGVARWRRVQHAVEEVCVPHIVLTDAAGSWRGEIARAVREGIRFFIAAGGDGTVSEVADALARYHDGARLDAFTLGAVGLGSSNDFHKPFGRVVCGIPLRVEPDGGRHDVGVARYVDGEGRSRRRHFVISASVGVVAEANAFFNRGDRLERWLRGTWTGAAILYAAEHTIASWRNIMARLRANGHTEPAAITNLSISKTPFVSGMFRYDAAVAPDDGLLAVHLCEAMSRVEALRALADLARGRFQGRPKRRTWHAPRLALAVARPAALELDGEVCRARRVVFGVLPDRIRVCR